MRTIDQTSSCQDCNNVDPQVWSILKTVGCKNPTGDNAGYECDHL